jgi:hypothetical protein
VASHVKDRSGGAEDRELSALAENSSCSVDAIQQIKWKISYRIAVKRPEGKNRAGRHAAGGRDDLHISKS